MFDNLAIEDYYGLTYLVGTLDSLDSQLLGCRELLGHHILDFFLGGLGLLHQTEGIRSGMY